jgi:hypothetical protein
MMNTIQSSNAFISSSGFFLKYDLKDVIGESVFILPLSLDST